MFENVTDFMRSFEKATEWGVDLGVFSDAANERPPSETKGVNNAELMFIHENGSPINGIPPRPVLELTINWALKSGVADEYLAQATDKIMNAESFDEISAIVKRIYEDLGNELVAYAQEMIYSNDGRLEPNAPSVIRQKIAKIKRDGNEPTARDYEVGHPLFDTGYLARSISYDVNKQAKQNK